METTIEYWGYIGVILLAFHCSRRKDGWGRSCVHGLGSLGLRARACGFGILGRGLE